MCCDFNYSPCQWERSLLLYFSLDITNFHCGFYEAVQSVCISMKVCKDLTQSFNSVFGLTWFLSPRPLTWCFKPPNFWRKWSVLIQAATGSSCSCGNLDYICMTQREFPLWNYWHCVSGCPPSFLWFTIEILTIFTCQPVENKRNDSQFPFKFYARICPEETRLLLDVKMFGELKLTLTNLQTSSIIFNYIESAIFFLISVKTEPLRCVLLHECLQHEICNSIRKLL